MNAQARAVQRQNFTDKGRKITRKWEALNNKIAPLAKINPRSARVEWCQNIKEEFRNNHAINEDREDSDESDVDTGDASPEEDQAPLEDQEQREDPQDDEGQHDQGGRREGREGQGEEGEHGAQTVNVATGAGEEREKKENNSQLRRLGRTGFGDLPVGEFRARDKGERESEGERERDRLHALLNFCCCCFADRGSKHINALFLVAPPSSCLLLTRATLTGLVECIPPLM